MNSYDKARKWYDKNADFYAKKSGIILNTQLKKFISLIPNNGTVLDIGSGPGVDVNFFRKRGLNAIGIDYSIGMINYAVKKYGDFFYKENILSKNKKYFKGQFDGVWMSSVITHFKDNDIEFTLKKINSSLNNSGIAAIIVPKRKKYKLKLRKDGIVFNEFWKKDILKYLRDANFKIIENSKFIQYDREWFFIIIRKK